MPAKEKVSKAVDTAAEVARDPVSALHEAEEKPGRLAVWVGAILASAALVWLAGFLLLRAAGQGTRTWDLVWGLGGLSFLSAFAPIPGSTAALLFALGRSHWMLGLLGVSGAALGGTAAAGMLLALGHTGREHLRKKATKSRRAKRFLAWSKKAARRWTYAGVFVLLIPQVIPRAVVLYAAVLAKLKAVPFLLVVLAGTFARNLLMLVAFKLGWGLVS